MVSIIKNIGEYWEENGFAFLVILSIVVLILIALYRWISSKSGSYNTKYTDGIDMNSMKPVKKRKGPPRESKGERECKRVMEKLFGKPFRKERPDVLRNTVSSDVDGGEYNLELDVYSSEVKLDPDHNGVAIEYNGRFHYEFVPFFHKSKEAFMNQRYRDELKRRMCKDNKIDLIEVSYKVKLEDIENYLKEELTKRGYEDQFVSD